MPPDAVPVGYDAMKIGVVRETYPGERRVAIVPGVVPSLTKADFEVLVEAGAGEAARYDDAEYVAKGASVCASRDEVFSQADLVCQVRMYPANAVDGQIDLTLMRTGQTVIGLCEPLSAIGPIETLAKTGVKSFALELLPRITKAQSMDVLSSQATVAGYVAVLMAAEKLPRMFPMLMTAAGTIAPAKVFVIGAGVAGLQAIATARRLGAVVTAYDVRPAVKEQVQSLGAKFLELELDTGESEGKGGYAKEMDEAFYEKQREMMAKAVVESDVVITTAAVPGRQAPVLVTGEMVQTMSAGSVIVDLAARPGAIGGNCDLTRPDDTIEKHGVTILGPTNLPSAIPQTASQMYARNIAAFVTHLIKESKTAEDEIVRDTLLTQNGEIVNTRVREHSL